MTCDQLAVTGQPVTMLLALAGAALVLGLLFVLSARSPGVRRAVLATALLAIGVFTAGSAAPSLARADQPGCGTGSAATGLTIVPVQPGVITQNQGTDVSPLNIGQISSPVGIAPGVGPAAIVGRLVNRGSEAIFVAAVTVEITSIDKAEGAAQGECDATDYELTNPIMPIGRTLLPGESAVFSGAFIGFRDKPVNQDACQAAIVGLGYFSS